MSKQGFPEQDVKSWELPFVEPSKNNDEDKTNAFNRRSDWKYEPPEPEVEVLPPTAEEIDAIRESAFEEGYAQGRVEGLAKGQEEGHEKGYQTGFEEGQKEGHEQGLASGEEQIKAELQNWQSLLTQLHQPIAQVDQQLQHELIQLAVSLARAVIRTEIKTNEDIILQALSEALKALPIQENVYQIHLHPDDIALVKAQYSDEYIEQQKWVLVESPALSRGGCDVTTQSNAVDVSIERRVRDVIDKFLIEQGLSDEASE